MPCKFNYIVHIEDCRQPVAHRFCEGDSFWSLGEDIFFPCPSYTMGRGEKQVQREICPSIEWRLFKSHATNERLAWIL